MVAPIVLASAIMGGAGLVGQLGGSYLSAQSSWKKQKKMFRWQKAWEKEKMQNAYQWAIDDMQKAGLNPALGYSQGGATGSGAPNPSSPTAPNYDVSGAIGQALDFYNSARQVDSQIGVNNANIGKTEAETAAQILDNELVTKYGDKEKATQIANTLQDTALKSAITAKTVEETNRIKGGKIAETTGTAVTEQIQKAYKKLQENQGSMSAKGWKSHLGGLYYTK